MYREWMAVLLRGRYRSTSRHDHIQLEGGCWQGWFIWSVRSAGLYLIPSFFKSFISIFASNRTPFKVLVVLLDKKVYSLFNNTWVKTYLSSSQNSNSSVILWLLPYLKSRFILIKLRVEMIKRYTRTYSMNREIQNPKSKHFTFFVTDGTSVLTFI